MLPFSQTGQNAPDGRILHPQKRLAWSKRAGIAKFPLTDKVRSAILLWMKGIGGMIHTLRWWLINNEPIPAEELEQNSTMFLVNYLDLRT